MSSAMTVRSRSSPPLAEGHGQRPAHGVTGLLRGLLGNLDAWVEAGSDHELVRCAERLDLGAGDPGVGQGGTDLGRADVRIHYVDLDQRAAGELDAGVETPDPQQQQARNGERQRHQKRDLAA
jgi:hypothetical protein